MPLVESTDLRFVARAAVPSAGVATIAGICGATAFGGSKSSGKTFFYIKDVSSQVLPAEVSHMAAFRMFSGGQQPSTRSDLT